MDKQTPTQIAKNKAKQKYVDKLNSIRVTLGYLQYPFVISQIDKIIEELLSTKKIIETGCFTFSIRGNSLCAEPIKLYLRKAII